MVLYGITLVPLSEELKAADPGILLPLYADDAAFDGSAQRSAQLLKLLMRRGPDRGHFPGTAKSLFISDTSGQEYAVKREFAAEGLILNFVSGSRYLGVNDVIGDKNVVTKIMNNSNGLQRIELNGFDKCHWKTGYYPFVYGWCLGLY